MQSVRCKGTRNPYGLRRPARSSWIRARVCENGAPREVPLSGPESVLAACPWIFMSWIGPFQRGFSFSMPAMRGLRLMERETDFACCACDDDR